MTNMSRTLMEKEKADNIQEQMGNVNREMKIVRKKENTLSIEKKR